MTTVFVCLSSTSTFTLVKSTSTFAYVDLSSGHNILNFAISPTDFALICKKIYSMSNIGNFSTSIFSYIRLNEFWILYSLNG